MTEKTAVLTLRDGLHFSVETGSGRTYSYDDLPADGLGPVEAVLASLAACSAMDVISIALKKRQGIERYVVRARGEQREEYPRVFTSIELVHDVTGSDVDTDAIVRCIELSATKYCPVNAMLSAGPTAVHHRYSVTRRGQEPETGEVLVTGPYRRPDVTA
jgi:putative redox protein